MEIIPGEGVVNSARIADIKAQKAAAYDKIQSQEAAKQIGGLAITKYAAARDAQEQAAINRFMEQQYLDSVQPSAEAAYASRLGVNNPYSGGTNFVPAGLAAYKQALAARNAPAGSLVDAPVQIVGDPRVAPTRFEDRSQFGKILEVLAQPYDPAADHGGM